MALLQLALPALLLSISQLAVADLPPSYPNAFVDPTYALSRTWPNSTKYAQQSIINWALESAAEGPWTVTSKTVMPPTNNTHDYLSWLPYWFPDCSNVGNTTVLTDQQVWLTCPYVVRDGQFNPDRLLVNDTGAFMALSDSVFANALAWAINGSSVFSSNVANFVNVWFVAPETAMNPNLDYAQLKRGPGVQKGSHTGVLDLKAMAKVASAVLIMRQGQAAEWTSAIDAGLVSWTREYIQWMETADIALEEKRAANNHGSYYFTQLAALKLIVNDKPGAISVAKEFFDGIYQDQITRNGSQPLELARTRPFHYITYNFAAMLTTAKIAQFAGYNAWNRTAKEGAGMKEVAAFDIAYPPRDEAQSELWPEIATTIAVYGDPDNTLTNFLKTKNPDYPVDPYFFYEQPVSDSGYQPPAGAGGSTGANNPGGGVNRANGAAGPLSVAMSGILSVSLFAILFL